MGIAAAVKKKATKKAVDYLKQFGIACAPVRKANPTKRKGAASPKRVSQITKKPPTKRLVKRRKANTEAGYFPNPNPKKKTEYLVQQLSPKAAGKWLFIASFNDSTHAMQYAKSMGRQHPAFAFRVVST